MTLLPIMASNLGIPPMKIGWLFSLLFVVYIFLQRPAGKWSDRRGRKKPILVGMSIYALAMAFLAWGGGLFYLMAALGIAGAGLGIYAASVRVAMADLSSDEVRGANMGFFFTTRMFGFFLGPNLSGMVADQWGYGFPFLIGAAILGLGILASSYLSPVLSTGRARLGPT
jgi:MFS family permease